jgi:hypothetical protein
MHSKKATLEATDEGSIPNRQRREKRDKDGQYIILAKKSTTAKKRILKRKSRALQKHGKDAPSGGIESLIPSLIGVGVLVCAVMAQRGFRGRASVAGIDLGTTNSVICVQAPSKSVGDIDCITDPVSGSNIIVSLYDSIIRFSKNKMKRMLMIKIFSPSDSLLWFPF